MDIYLWDGFSDGPMLCNNPEEYMAHTAKVFPGTIYFFAELTTENV